MKEVNTDMWATPRSWQIIIADVDLAHVFAPSSTLTVEPTGDGGGFSFKNPFQAPSPDCFSGTRLIRAGTSQPTFEQMTGELCLPSWSNEAGIVDRYTRAQDRIRSYLQADPDVQRLQGHMRIPCHAHGAKLDTKSLQGHAPMWVNTLVHVYQFANVVNGDRPLLVIWAPLSPVCPMNGNGTVLGLG